MNRTTKPRDLRSMLESCQEVTILDVWRKADYDAVHGVLPDDEWCDPEKVEAWSMDLPKDKEIVLYCEHGGSVSNMVLDQLLNTRGAVYWRRHCGVERGLGKIIEKLLGEAWGNHDQ